MYAHPSLFYLNRLGSKLFQRPSYFYRWPFTVTLGAVNNYKYWTSWFYRDFCQFFLGKLPWFRRFSCSPRNWRKRDARMAARRRGVGRSDRVDGHDDEQHAQTDRHEQADEARSVVVSPSAPPAMSPATLRRSRADLLHTHAKNPIKRNISSVCSICR